MVCLIRNVCWFHNLRVTCKVGSSSPDDELISNLEMKSELEQGDVQPKLSLLARRIRKLGLGVCLCLVSNLLPLLLLLCALLFLLLQFLYLPCGDMATWCACRRDNTRCARDRWR